ncbi:conserved hypothetical protein [Methylocella tundrae]|uniref:Sulfotransferase family protein n=1 Tax=Methylocella tundrae TaxID=227605 RepID=A0A8B6M410_METTU|nr:hypothetical protein [Methylocella tundrae]VTZ25416.1 conserved hypothetical protein [Methylocella tundrae]VTZ49534.1 conserved hypothetical protein [Methylocella tundrae]
MNNIPRIVIHVGAPKTGSTYLQKRLRADPAHLRRNGIYVPVLPSVAQMAGNAKLLATVLSKRPSLSFERIFPNIDVTRLRPAAIVSELLRDWRSDEEAIVLSAENFRPEHAGALRELLPTCRSCVVVLFVRRQDQWIESYFNQLTKTADVAEDLSSFVTRLCDTQGERFCRPDWNTHYEAWRHAFGACNIIFYDEARSDLFSAFLSAAGLPIVPDLIEVPPAQVSLNIHELAYLLALERPFSHADFVRHRVAGEEASKRLASGVRSILGEAEHEKLRQRFEASNHNLLTALGRANEPKLLQLTPSTRRCDLNEVYASDDYVRYRKLADEIFSARSLDSV